MEAGEYCVYRLVDPTDNTTRYVGLTKDRTNRYHAHLSAMYGEGSLEKRTWISDLKKQGLKPQMIIIEDHLSKEEAFAREAQWIRRYQSQGVNLYNNLKIRMGHQEILDILREHIDLLNQVVAQEEIQQTKDDLQQRTQSLLEDLSTNYRLRLIPLSQYYSSSKRSA